MESPFKMSNPDEANLQYSGESKQLYIQDFSAQNYMEEVVWSKLSSF